MKPIPIEDRLFEWMETPDPLEESFLIHVSKSKWKGMPAGIVLGVTTYQELARKCDALSNPLANEKNNRNYVFTDKKNSPVDGWFEFWFAKPKTAEEAAIPFRITPKFAMWDWDSIMIDLHKIEDDAFPRVTYGIVGGQKTLIAGPSFDIRPEHIEGGQKGTLFTIEEFISPTPFDIPRYRTPIAKTVAWAYGGRQGVFRSCLHVDLSIEESRSVTQALAGSTQLQNPGIIAGQEFPATNMTRWQRHVISCEQEFTNGVWHMRRIWANPPPLEEPETTAS